MTKRCLFGLVLLGSIGCSGTDDAAERSLGQTPRYPVPGCETHDHRACDVRTTACQSQLLALAACLRGDDPGELPRVSVMTEGEYAAYLTDRGAQQEPRPNPDHYERALSMLGLVEPGAFAPEAMAADSVAFVWGVFRSETKDVVLIDHGEDFDDLSASPVLVHEFIHVLQDRDVDLHAFQTEHGTSYDADLAVGALIDGEARMHQSRYGASVLGLDPAAIDWTKTFENSVEQSEEWVLGEPSPYLASYQSFPYEWGARFVHSIWESGGFAAVLERFASPPATSHALMASAAGAPDEDVAPNVLPAPIPPSDWTPIADTVLGAWGTFLLLAGHSVDVGQARTLSLGWRGDGLFVFAGTGSPNTALVWRVDFADEATAAAVVAIASARVGGVVERQGTRVVLAMSDGPLPLDWAFAP